MVTGHLIWEETISLPSEAGAGGATCTAAQGDRALPWPHVLASVGRCHCSGVWTSSSCCRFHFNSPMADGVQHLYVLIRRLSTLSGEVSVKSLCPLLLRQSKAQSSDGLEIFI